MSTIAYDRHAAVDWAGRSGYETAYESGGNYRDGRGENANNRFCTTYIAKMLYAGGIDISGPYRFDQGYVAYADMNGNDELSRWLIAHPDFWEARSISQLEGIQAGDFALLNYDSDSDYGWDCKGPIYDFQSQCFLNRNYKGQSWKGYAAHSIIITGTFLDSISDSATRILAAAWNNERWEWTEQEGHYTSINWYLSKFSPKEQNILLIHIKEC
jgi:hypothetical protein